MSAKVSLLAPSTPPVIAGQWFGFLISRLTRRICHDFSTNWRNCLAPAKMCLNI